MFAPWRSARAGGAALAAAGAIAGLILAGCGPATGLPLSAGPSRAGYRVLAGRTSGPAGGAGESSEPARAGATGFLPESESGGRWWITGSAATALPLHATVDLLSAGRPGEHFELFWQESCGGTRVGARGVEGGSGGQGRLMLETPARVQVELLAPVGNYDQCYLAATVFVHTATWRDAKRKAPRIRILYSA